MFQRKKKEIAKAPTKNRNKKYNNKKSESDFTGKIQIQILKTGPNPGTTAGLL